MDVYLIVLRILHIGAGVFWVGASLLFFFIIQPAVKATGPSGGEVMGYAVEKKKLPVVIVTAGAVTVLAGILLYWRSSNGLDVDWITSATGLAFTLGGAAATLAWLFGLLIVAPAVNRTGAIGAEVRASGGPPSDAQAAELQRLGGRLRWVGITNTSLLIFAVLAMAVARYL